jgi:hypothetical protein
MVKKLYLAIFKISSIERVRWPRALQNQGFCVYSAAPANRVTPKTQKARMHHIRAFWLFEKAVVR